MQERDGLRSRAGGRSQLIDVVGDVRINAGDRTARVVEVPPKPPEPDRAGRPAGSPHDPSSEEDLEAADRTRVEFADDHLVVRAPKLRLGSPRSAGVVIRRS